jgi:hypothetical protein
MAARKQKFEDCKEVWLTVYGAARNLGNDRLAKQAVQNLRRFGITLAGKPETTPEFSLSEYTFLAQTATVLGLIDYKTGAVSAADLAESQELHITTATELKHHIQGAVEGIIDEPEKIKVISRLGYLFGIHTGRLSWGKK